jgi:hypothetical protein
MGCGCNDQKLPAPGTLKDAAKAVSEKPGSRDMFPEGYFWNGPSPKKT